MKNKYSSIIVGETTIKQMQELPPETRLKFYDAIMQYGLSGEEPEFSGLEKALWISMVDLTDSLNAAFRANRENGGKGGRPKTQNNPTEPNETQNNPTEFGFNSVSEKITQKNLQTETETETETRNKKPTCEAGTPPVAEPGISPTLRAGVGEGLPYDSVDSANSMNSEKPKPQPAAPQPAPEPRPPDKPQPATAHDRAATAFCDAFCAVRGIPYAVRTADCVQLANLRKAMRVPPGGIPDGWALAVANYLGTPQGKYTLADLVCRYDVFRRSPLDRYGKPLDYVQPSPRNPDLYVGTGDNPPDEVSAPQRKALLLHPPTADQREAFRQSMEGFESNTPKGVYDTWFRPLRLAGHSYGKLYIATPTRSFASRVRENFASRFAPMARSSGAASVDFVPDGEFSLRFGDRSKPISTADMAQSA
jgi:hypothetical protein